ncbi:MAG: S-layer homology domain-containing protein [Clostridiales Family XIII bacterium]|jgi:exo-beta-1,3-glucanase (GH17 family)|nr:S-layer homology domain-containing protein [Clostridiales Family XIII bacterium]
MSRKSLFCAIALCIVPIAALLAAQPAAGANDAAKPRIAIDSVPALGQGSALAGHIWFAGEAGDFDDYAITMALEVTRGGEIWGPKPTFANPSVSLGDNGFFRCPFVTGGNDLQAERLYVYLIPIGFTPNDDISRTEAAATDRAVIDRYANGRVDVRQTAAPESASPEAAARPASAFPRQKHPKDNDKLSLCYSPYTNGLSPETDSTVPIEQMRWQLNLIYPYADTIRFFGVSGELEKIYRPAKDEYHMRIIAGCWIDGQSTDSQIYAELDKLIALANSGYADIAVVGSETIYRNDFSADTLISYINYVRARIADKNIPVGTSDTSAVFLNHPELVQSCDVILCTIYPFFSEVPAENAAHNLSETYERVLAVAEGRQLIISETGWPTEGSPEGAAVPSIENARRYFEDVYAWSRENDVEVVFFSETDEAWKVEGTNGDIGGHWGHFSSVGMLKDAYLPVYQNISAAPVLDADTVKWAEEAIQDLVRRGVADAGGPALYEPLLPITRGDFIHYLVKALALEDKTGRVGTTFTDIDPNLYYYFTLGAGQKAGLVAGVGGGLCLPLSSITRQDMFTLIYRALQYADTVPASDSANPKRFADDADIAAYAKDAVSALAAGGLIVGDPSDRVNPRGNATRAEAAVLLYRVYALVNGE